LKAVEGLVRRFQSRVLDKLSLFFLKQAWAALEARTG